MDELRVLAHKLKSGSASVGADALSRKLADLETAARAGRLDGAAQAIREIDQEFERIKPALKEVA